MKSFYRINIIVLFIFTSFSVIGSAQTGAAGVGNLSNNAFWIDIHALGLPNGFAVTNVNDQSGNGVTFTQPQASRRPTINSTAINGLPALVFDGLNDFIDGPAQPMLDSPELTYFIVFDKSPLDAQSLICASYASQLGKWRSYCNSNNDIIYNGHQSPTLKHVSYTDLNSFTFISLHITSTTLRIYRQGNLMMTKTTGVDYTVPNGHQKTRIGNFSNAFSGNNTYCLNGSIAEVIVYNTSLTNLQRNLVENYLGAKYNMAIPTDLYAHQATHNIGLIAVGNNGVNSQTTAKGAGILTISNPLGMTANEYLLAAHTNVALDQFNTADIPPSLPGYKRWTRTWRVDETGEVGFLTLTFDLTGGNNFGQSSTYTLLIDNVTQDGDFSDATAVTGTYNAGLQTMTFITNLNAGVYFTLCAIEQIPEIHAINTGLWSDPNTWDCVCIPTAGSNVYIDPNVVVTVDMNAETDYFSIGDPGGQLIMNSNFTLSIYGDWDLLGSVNITDGTIELVGTADQYIDAGGNPVSLNNLTIDNPGNNITFFSSEYTLNGLMTPTNGNLIIDPSPGTEFIVNSTSGTGGASIGEVTGAFTFTGDFIIRRFIPAGIADWRDIAAPTSGATLAAWDNDIAISGTGFPDGCAYGPDGCFFSVTRYFNFANNNITNPNFPLVQTHGYEVFIGDDLNTFSGATLSVKGPVDAGDVTSPAIGTGWSIQGNPFPSPILFPNITLNSQVDNYFYVYDNASGAYEWYDGATNTSSIPELTNGFIASGQGFWTYDWGSITFLQSSKTTTTGTFLRSHGGADLSLNITLYENASTYHSTMSICENLAGDDILDTIFDIRHLSTGNEKAPGIALYSNEDLIRKNYIKDDRRNKSFDLYTKILNDGYYTVEASNIENFNNYRKVLLFDNQTGEFVDLKKEIAYTFYSDIFEGHRFTLVLTNEEVSDGASIQSLTVNETIENGVTLTQMGHTFNLNSDVEFSDLSTVSLVNVLGQQEVFTQSLKVVAGSNLISIPETFKGVHVLVITTGDERITKKVVL